MSRDVWARLAGEQVLSEGASYDIEHVEHGGEAYSVEVTVDLGGLELTLDFALEEAEEFIVRFRDEVVRAKQAKLEWETDTDVDSGVDDGEDGS